MGICFLFYLGELEQRARNAMGGGDKLMIVANVLFWRPAIYPLFTMIAGSQLIWWAGTIVVFTGVPA
jgi:hypothetical protein